MFITISEVTKAAKKCKTVAMCMFLKRNTLHALASYTQALFHSHMHIWRMEKGLGTRLSTGVLEEEEGGSTEQHGGGRKGEREGNRLPV